MGLVLIISLGIKACLRSVKSPSRIEKASKIFSFFSLHINMSEKYNKMQDNMASKVKTQSPNISSKMSTNEIDLIELNLIEHWTTAFCRPPYQMHIYIYIYVCLLHVETTKRKLYLHLETVSSYRFQTSQCHWEKRAYSTFTAAI